MRTALVRIRFPYDLVDRLDRLAERIRGGSRRRIPRAALVRALVVLHMGAADENRQDLTKVLGADPVKRGREKGPRPRPQAVGAPALEETCR